jgi:exodeoxyribonuclease-3
MKVISFNVNGLRAILQKDKQGKRDTGKDNVLVTLAKEQDPDIICLQEIKCSHDTVVPIAPLAQYYPSITQACSTVKKGYSGVAILSKVPPMNTMTIPDDKEGRVLVAEYANVYVVCVYTPNSKADLSRLEERVNSWDVNFRSLLARLDAVKPVIVAGDLNVAHQPIDIHKPVGARGANGFTDEERASFSTTLRDVRLLDTFRTLHPQKQAYSWFSPFLKTREKGWRIDYILISERLMSKVTDAEILPEYYGSDHVPISCAIAC